MSTPDTPSSHVPPVPRYGEYAPPGHVPPVQPAAEPVFAQQPYGQPVLYAQPGERPRRTWDLVLSIVLLVVGFFSVLVAILNAFTLTMQMNSLYEQYGLSGGYTPGTGTAIAQAVILISQPLLYVLAVIFTIALLRKNRVAFWLPLSVGVLASIVFFAAVMALALSDPALLDAAMKQAA